MDGAHPHLLSGLNSCDLKPILYCSGLIISLSSSDMCSLQWKEEGLPEDLGNICYDMIVSLYAPSFCLRSYRQDRENALEINVEKCFL